MSREQQQTEQATVDTEIESRPAPVLSGNPRLLKTQWRSLVCDKCVLLIHFLKHKERFGTEYHGTSAYNCPQKPCRRMISVLWQSNFERSKDCSHSHNAAPSKETYVCSPSDNLRSPTNPGRWPKITSTQPQNKISKNPTHKPARKRDGKFKKRTREESNIHMEEQIADPTESAAALDRQAGLLEQVPDTHLK